MLSLGGDHLRILVHACSIGAEPYSLAQWWLHKVKPRCTAVSTIEIVATDLDAGFLAYAQQGCYPNDLRHGMTEVEQSWFELSDGQLSVPRAVRELVHFAQPMSFVDAELTQIFDAVLVMNALTYVSPTEQSLAIKQIARYARQIIALTAFHPDSIRQDIVQGGFTPCMANHRQIHEAWGDRLASGPIAPDSPEYSWRLPPYDQSVADHPYRFGTIFCRTQSA